MACAGQERRHAGLEPIRLGLGRRHQEETMRAEGAEEVIAADQGVGLTLQFGVLRRFHGRRQVQHAAQETLGQSEVPVLQGVAGRLKGLVELPLLGRFFASRRVLVQFFPKRGIGVARQGRRVRHRLGWLPVPPPHAPVDVPLLVVGLAFEHQERGVRGQQAPFLRDRQDLPAKRVLGRIHRERDRLLDCRRLGPNLGIESLQLALGPEATQEHVVLLRIDVEVQAAFGRLAVLLNRKVQSQAQRGRGPPHDGESCARGAMRPDRRGRPGSPRPPPGG